MHDPAPPPPTRARRVAAGGVWAVAAVEVVLFGCCSGLGALVALVPAEAFAGVPIPPEVGSLETLRAAAAFQAIVLFVALVLPGLVLAGLGVGVWQGHRLSSRVARWLLLGQAVLLGLLLLLSLLAAARSPAQALFGAIVFGGLLGLVLWTASRLHGLDDAVGWDDADDIEPWNSHLAGR